jgi:predicted nucleotidyltransferase
MSGREILDQIKPRLARAFGARLQGVVLYGSTARGDAGPDSDIDILVLLTAPVQLWPDIRLAVRAVYPLSLRWGRPISPKPADVREFEAGDCPLYRVVQVEGIRQ